jgi:ribosome production factor 2
MPKRAHPQLTSRGKRVLSRRDPQLVEGERSLLTLRGPKASARGVAALRFFSGMKKGASRPLTRKNDIRPFEDLSSLEFLAGVNNCSAFALASHTKKRPDNLVLVRLLAWRQRLW